MPIGTMDNGLDYATLFAAGLRLTQIMSADIWTDYNLHDPGVTVLQQLCYALTDIGYRAQWPVADLLTLREEPPQPDRANASNPSGQRESPLFTGPEILTCAPVTARDFRSLIYSQVEDLENAWFRKSADSRGIQGLYDVDVQLYRPFVGDIAIPRGDVMRLYMRTRPLCEDVGEIRILKSLPIAISADIDIDATDTANDIAANIFSRLESNLIPAPSYTSIHVMREAGRPYDEIFEGPAMNVMIDNASPDQRPSQLAIAEFARIARGAGGVVRIRRLGLRAQSDGLQDSDSIIQWDSDVVPTISVPSTLRPREGGAPDFVLRQAGAPQNLDVERVINNILHRKFMDRQDVLSTTRAIRSDPYNEPPTGVFRSPEVYTSIREQFPMIYGLGRYGAPRDFLVSKRPVVADRRARAVKIRQLEAYLLLFEQVMANHLAQLANIPLLFSLSDAASRATYFWQPLEPDRRDAQAPATIGDLLPADYPRSLSALVEKHDTAIERRQRLLDHLLARFNEGFEDSELDRAWEAGCTTADDIRQMKSRRNAVKAEFLRDYVFVGGFRGVGLDYSPAGGAERLAAEPRASESDQQDPASVQRTCPGAGLERRVKLLTGISELYVVEHVLLRNRLDVLDADLADFYSLKLSVVCADSIGGQSALRPLVEHAVEDNCPAHIGTFFVYLAESEMIAFRTLYADWRSACAQAFERAGSPDCTALDGRSRALREFLRDPRRGSPS
ncbi:MAG: hypothetical protein ABR970_03990 [Roseiarcus sp.]